MPAKMDNYNAHEKIQKRPMILSGMFAFIAFFLFWAAFLKPSEPLTVNKAMAVLKSPEGKTYGTVYFEQEASHSAVTVTGELKGLESPRLRGFHIHSLGDATNGCLSSGSHFNPYSTTHGAPEDSERHVGDLGNIAVDKNGVAGIRISDKLISLNGAHSIVGRTVVLHEGTDDLGRGDNDESLKTGNAGGRAACGIIGIAA